MDELLNDDDCEDDDYEHVGGWRGNPEKDKTTTKETASDTFDTVTQCTHATTLPNLCTAVVIVRKEKDTQHICYVVAKISNVAIYVLFERFSFSFQRKSSCL